MRAAEAGDRPVLLDIGAVWCHWCHVMDGESYENPDLAAFLNDNFICIKVDRDERPDVDARYQRAVQMLTQQGGWPLTAFLTPRGEVFFGGTYFPPDGKFGRPGFRTVLASVLDAYHSRRDQVQAQAQAIRRVLDEQLNEAAPGEVSPALLDQAVSQMTDAIRPGERRLRQPAEVSPSRSAQPPAASLVRPTVRSDPDHHRSNPPGHGPRWNARSARWRLSPIQRGRPVDRAPLREDVLRQLGAAQGLCRRVCPLRDRGVCRRGAGYRALGAGGLARIPQGGYAASQDADVGLEDDGDYFTWTREEAAAVLTPEELDVAADYYDIGTAGEMDHDPGKNVLFVAATYSSDRAPHRPKRTGNRAAAASGAEQVARSSVIAGRSHSWIAPATPAGMP